MDEYTRVSQLLSRTLTLQQPTLFGSAMRLVDASLRDDIFAIYGLVRAADEIVTSLTSPDAQEVLDGFEAEVYAAMSRGYSANPIVHAFQVTANMYGISHSLLRPFFASMRMDITPPRHYTQKAYETYIHGSAEVVGLMCLKVLVRGNQRAYNNLKAGAMRLGAAYQKVSFLRDFAADSQQRQRIYFPNIENRRLNEAEKAAIIADTQTDFAAAQPYITVLPNEARLAVAVSYAYYHALMDKLQHTPAEVICQEQVRITTVKKIFLTARTAVLYAVRPRAKKLGDGLQTT